MILSAKDIKSCVGEEYYKRGIEYYAHGRVLTLKESYYDDEDGEQAIEIISSVQASANKIYEQEIDIFYDYDKLQFTIEGNCSCPIGSNCKHVAAVCIVYRANKMSGKIKEFSGGNAMQTQTPLKDSLVDNWLNGFKTTPPQIATQKRKKSHDGYFLTYRLDGESNEDKNHIHFFKTKWLKNGKLSRGVRLNPEKVFDKRYKALQDGIDEEIIKTAKIFLKYNYYHSQMEELSGSVGAFLVREVVKSKRCYYEYNQDPLTLSDEIFHVEFEFKAHAGEYLLKSNLHKKEYHILKTSPLFVIDTINNTVFELDIDMKTYEQIEAAPKFSKESLARAYTKIVEKAPTLAIKTPKTIEVKKIQTPPKPRIKLQESSFLLDFLYEGHAVKYYPTQTVLHRMNKTKKVEIFRDLSAEDEARDRVESLGFVMKNIDDDLVVELHKKDRQAQLLLWKNFLENELQKLEEEGWIAIEDKTFSMKFEPSTDVVVESEDENNWFSLSFNLEFNGISQPIAPLVSGIIAEFDSFESMPESINIEVEKNHFVEVKSKQIKPIIQTILELYDKKEKDENLKIAPHDAHLLEFMDDDVIWRGSKDILALSKKLKDFKGIKKAKPPKVLNATLRDYQQDGLNWLNFLHEFKFGGILADDMGLGKTIQTLAHLSRLKEKKLLKKPSLVVMPTSLIANWKKEAAKFTPNLKILSLHGAKRAKQFEVLDEYDVLLTTYPLIVRDQERFKKLEFYYIILDEAQKIKNHKTKMAIALKSFSCEYKLALSGTPIENHLGELWSIFSFLMPGFLDTLSFFKNYYQTPIEKEHNFERQNLLNKRIKPFILRRTKEIVADELPEKSEIIKYTQFSDKQSQLYESIRVTMEKKVREAVDAKGLGSSHITILDALLKLRQVCCDPSLLKIEEAQKVKESAKLELLLELVDELLEEGRKILLFSQFTSMLSIIEEKIVAKNISYVKLTGSTQKREEVIEKFSNGEADLFLISLKAGGVGLNLTEADTVIHYDPWWNPAVENQATDRAHRIGQKKKVFVYKLIVENTIEQKILEMQQKKQKLQDGIYDEKKQQDDLKFDGSELLKLLQ